MFGLRYGQLFRRRHQYLHLVQRWHLLRDFRGIELLELHARSKLCFWVKRLHRLLGGHI